MAQQGLLAMLKYKVEDATNRLADARARVVKVESFLKVRS